MAGRYAGGVGRPLRMSCRQWLLLALSTRNMIKVTELYEAALLDSYSEHNVHQQLYQLKKRGLILNPFHGYWMKAEPEGD